MNTTKQHFTEVAGYAWLVILLCSGLLFYKYVLSVSPSVMTQELMREFQISGARLGNLAATFFYTFLVVQLFAGILLDKFGTRWLASFSVFVSALGAFLFAHAHTILAAEWARAMMGFGAAFATVAYLKMAAVWFKPRQMAFVGGLLATAVMVGAVCGQAPLAMLVEAAGWRHSLEVCAGAGLLIAVLFAAFVRDNSPQMQVVNTQQSFSFTELKAVLSKPQNWLLTFYSGLAFSPLAVFGGLWGNPFLREAHQLTRVEAASLISIMFVGLGVGSPLFGLLSDKLGKRRPVMCAGTALSLAALVVLVFVPVASFPVLVVLLFLFGFGTGAFMLCFALGRQLNSLAMAATVIALINTGDGILGSLSEPMIGKLLDLGWNHQLVDGVRYFSIADYHVAFLPLLVYLLLALVSLKFITESDSAS